jgi:hypothetical protein
VVSGHQALYSLGLTVADLCNGREAAWPVMAATLGASWGGSMATWSVLGKEREGPQDGEDQITSFCSQWKSLIDTCSIPGIVLSTLFNPLNKPRRLAYIFIIIL